MHIYDACFVQPLWVANARLKLDTAGEYAGGYSSI